MFSNESINVYFHAHKCANMHIHTYKLMHACMLIVSGKPSFLIAYRVSPPS